MKKLTLAFAVVALTAFSFVRVNVTRGDEEPRRVVASEFGFNVEDSTEALQKAIDSGADVVYVDRQSTPWIVGKTLELRDNLTLVLEEGAEILAKKGEFTGLGDVLIRCVNTKNVTIRGEGKMGATLRMRKSDYQHEPYRKSEWRHGISLSSVENVEIYNLKIAETGGDGIYLGTSGVTKKPCRNVVIRKVDCVENHRQGISVINVDGLLLEDCLLRDTCGTAPEAGIDFEPNSADEQITNVVVRRVVALNNAGDGFAFYLPNLRQRGHELSFTLIDCDSVRNAGVGLLLTVANGEDKRLSGKMSICDSRFVGNRHGVAVRSKWAAGAPLLFKDVTIKTPAADKAEGYSWYRGVSSQKFSEEKYEDWTTTTAAGVTLIAVGDDEEANGGIRFENTTIIDTSAPDPERPLFALRDASADSVGFVDLSGTIRQAEFRKSTFSLPDEKVDFVKNFYKPRVGIDFKLDKETLGRLFPNLSARRVSSWNLENLNTESGAAISRELVKAWRDRPTSESKPLRLRGDATYYFHAEDGEKVKLTFQQRKIGPYEPKAVAVAIVDQEGNVREYDPLLATEEPLEVEYDAHGDGWRRVHTDFGASTLELVAASVVTLTAASPKLDAFCMEGKFEFYLPEGANDLGIRVVGSAEERVTATLFDPDGTEVARLSDVDQLGVWTAPTDESGLTTPLKSGFWSIQFDKPSSGFLEDYIFSIQGVPALLR